MLSKLEYFSQAVARIITLVGLTGLTLIALLVVADVLGRWIFNVPIEGTQDIIAVLLPVSIGASIPSVITTRGNISVRFLQNLLGQRIGQAFDVLSGVVGTMLLAFISWSFVKYTTDLARHNETTWILHIPTAPSWAIFTFLIGLSALFQFILIFRDFYEVFNFPNKHQVGD